MHIEDILSSYSIVNIRHVVIKTLEVISMADVSRARNVLVDRAGIYSSKTERQPGRGRRRGLRSNGLQRRWRTRRPPPGHPVPGSPLEAHIEREL